MNKISATDKAVEIYGNADYDCQICFKYGIQLTDDAKHVKENIAYYLEKTPATLIIQEKTGIGYTAVVGEYKIK